ncbi:MAG: hypothetical protein FWH47_03910 [Methanomassiliicoccaceae archaeon]|nr:hypothetical protein [Methanomassiliicoccaceae archaeon]
MPTDSWWGWVPNISGDVCAPSNVEQVIKKNEGKREFLYEYRSRNKVVVSTPWGKVNIDICDDGRGMCSLCIAETEVESDMTTEVRLQKVWKEFRKMLDSCSDEICDCIAMNQPIWSDATRIEQSIADAFVSMMEEISDAGAYIPINFVEGPETPEHWAYRMGEAIKVCNIAKINHLYGVRFMEIYIDKFEVSRRVAIKKIMDTRRLKAETIYEAVTRLSEVRFKKHSNDVSTLSLNTAVESLEATRRSLRYTRLMLVTSLVAAVAALAIIFR